LADFPPAFIPQTPPFCPSAGTLQRIFRASEPVEKLLLLFIL